MEADLVGCEDRGAGGVDGGDGVVAIVHDEDGFSDGIKSDGARNRAGGDDRDSAGGFVDDGELRVAGTSDEKFCFDFIEGYAPEMHASRETSNGGRVAVED